MLTCLVRLSGQSVPVQELKPAEMGRTLCQDSLQKPSSSRRSLGPSGHQCHLSPMLSSTNPFNRLATDSDLSCDHMNSVVGVQETSWATRAIPCRSRTLPDSSIILVAMLKLLNIRSSYGLCANSSRSSLYAPKAPLARNTLFAYNKYCVHRARASLFLPGLP